MEKENFPSGKESSSLEKQKRTLFNRKRELEKELKQLEEKIEKTEELQKIQRKEKTRKKIESFTLEVQEKILNLLDHDPECEKYNIDSMNVKVNGYGSVCKKCLLAQIFRGEWGDYYDFKFDVKIIDNETGEEI